MVIQGISYMSDFEAKKAMITAAAKLAAKGSMVAGDGSLSVRVGPNAVWITVEGADKSALTQDQMVRIDLNGKQTATNKPKALSPDLDAHLKIYRENEAVQAVIHAYPVCAVILGAKGCGVEAAGFTPSVRKLGRITLTHSADPKGSADEIALLCKTDNGAIIPNDGCMMWGRRVQDAVNYMESLDYYCKAAKCLDCGHGSCGSSCTGAAAGHHCDGNCGSCERSACCPDRMKQSYIPAQPAYTAPQSFVPEPVQVSASVSAPEPVASVLPSGMTGLIRPGSALPPLPENDPKPLPAKTPAPAASASAPAVRAGSINAAGKPDLVIHAPKSSVMAEVVRRSLMQ